MTIKTPQPAENQHGSAAQALSKTVPMLDQAAILKMTKLPRPILKVVFYLLRINTLEKVYQSSTSDNPLAVIEQCIATQNIKMQFSAEDLSHIPATGPFIVICNHPFGFLDGVHLIASIGRRRPNFKVTANFLLGLMTPIKDLFITVNPFIEAGGRDKKEKTMNGSAQVMEHLAKGFGVGIYPAGEVSTYQKNALSGKYEKFITDKEWSHSAIKLIKRANVPVIPAYVHGVNSPSFHWLGKLHPIFRTLRIPAEFLTKKNRTIPISIEQAISSDIINQFEDTQELSNFLRTKVYQQADKFKDIPLL